MPLPQIANEDLVEAADWNAIVDTINAVEAGTHVLTKVTLDGDASDPAVSAAGEAVIAYNTTTGELRQSVNGGAYERLGGKKPYEDPALVGGTMFGFRY